MNNIDYELVEESRKQDLRLEGAEELRIDILRELDVRINHPLASHEERVFLEAMVHLVEKASI